MFLLLIFTAIAIYSLRSIIFYFGVLAERRNGSRNSSVYEPMVSVVIAARNEENNILSCLTSITNNNYPKERFEIIVVNDRSTDRTGNILENIKSKIDNLRILTIENDAQKKNLHGKPGAIALGIAEARGEIIMMTDADCEVNPNWIISVIEEFSNDEVGLVASFTNVTGKRVFDKFQAVEWAYLHTMASGGIGLKQPLGCYGNNLSVRKSDYNAVGGYTNIKFSVTEDLALLQAISNSGKQVRYITKAEADVDTKPCLTLKEYFLQRHRWAVGGLGLGWKALIFVLSSSFLYLGLISAATIGSIPLFIAILMTRLFWDYLLISSSFELLNKKELIRWIPLSVGLFIILELIVPFLLLKRNVVWKGQIFKR